MKKSITKGTGLRRVIASCNRTNKTAGDVSESLAWLQSKRETDPLAAYVLALSRILTFDSERTERASFAEESEVA
jgi:hypothetical protein